MDTYIRDQQAAGAARRRRANFLLCWEDDMRPALRRIETRGIAFLSVLDDILACKDLGYGAEANTPLRDCAQEFSRMLHDLVSNQLGRIEREADEVGARDDVQFDRSALDEAVERWA